MKLQTISYFKLVYIVLIKIIATKSQQKKHLCKAFFITSALSTVIIHNKKPLSLQITKS